MDAIYAFLDGLVLLTTEDSPNMKELDKAKRVRGTLNEVGLHNLLDLRDAVSDDPLNHSCDSDEFPYRLGC